MSETLPIREGEEPWTPEEVAEVRAELAEEEARLLGELDTAAADMRDLISDSTDGAGDDQADAGSNTFEREQEMALLENAKDMLFQTRHAIERLAQGRYGICENCQKPIGKGRLQAFPRATLCITCKQEEERR
jgi:DnaK suppressor protein